MDVECRTVGRMESKIDEQLVHRRIFGCCINSWTDRWVDRWQGGGRMSGLMDVWLVSWMDERLND